jgi:preprotein translocase subunit YajC
MCGFCMAATILLVVIFIGLMSVSFFLELREQQEENAKNCSLVEAVKGVPDPVEWAYTNAGCA